MKLEEVLGIIALIACGGIIGYAMSVKPGHSIFALFVLIVIVGLGYMHAKDKGDL